MKTNKSYNLEDTINMTTKNIGIDIPQNINNAQTVTIDKIEYDKYLKRKENNNKRTLRYLAKTKSIYLSILTHKQFMALAKKHNMTSNELVIKLLDETKI